MAKKKLTDQQLRDFALARVPQSQRQVKDVGPLFATYGTRSVSPQGYRLPVVRCSEELGSRLAAYGNTHNLSISATIRRLLEIGLDAEERRD